VPLQLKIKKIIIPKRKTAEFIIKLSSKRKFLEINSTSIDSTLRERSHLFFSRRETSV
jgi:hypothetical protein